MDAGTAAYAQRATPDQKLAILQQAAEDEGGLGKVKIVGQEIGYEPVQHAAAGPASGFAKGRSRLGT